LMLPPKGAILFSIADRDKPEALPIITKFAEIGFRIYATEGTAAMIKEKNIPVTMISKKLSQGQPNIIDLIINGSVDGVINTITGGRTVLKDGFAIRRAVAEKRLPYFTSLDTIRAVLMALSSKTKTYNTEPLPEYRKRK